MKTRLYLLCWLVLVAIVVMSNKKAEPGFMDDVTLAAYHEAGHAVVAHVLFPDSVTKVFISEDGDDFGGVVYRTGQDNALGKEELIAKICVSYAGRVSEKIIAGTKGVNGGIGSDFLYATNVAKQMVLLWDMADNPRHIVYGTSEENGKVNIDMDLVTRETHEWIHKEITAITRRGYQCAEEIIEKHRQELDAIAEALLLLEELDAEQIKALMSGKSAHDNDFPAKADGKK